MSAVDPKSVADYLLKRADRIAPEEAELRVPRAGGLHAIFVDDPRSLPRPFAETLSNRNSDLLYIGGSERNLYERLVDEDLRHRYPSTFFRSLGAVLGYTPPEGSLRRRREQYNFEFSREDTRKIIAWINSHLAVTWVELESPEVDEYGRVCIRLTRPLLNIHNNPDAMPELRELRSKCLWIARGGITAGQHNGSPSRPAAGGSAENEERGRRAYVPTPADLDAARQAFLQREPRDLFYRTAAFLVDQAFRGRSPLALAEALAVLLQTWNAPYYQYRGFYSNHFDEIEQLLSRHEALLRKLRGMCIQDFGMDDEVPAIFQAFEDVLGPVGAAKALHLLCPKLFPLWDRAIARSYGVELGPAGTNKRRYCSFMVICRAQVLRLAGQMDVKDDILKRLDEFNYCRYSKRWI